MADADSGEVGMLVSVMALTVSRTRGRVGWRAAWVREARLKAEESPKAPSKVRVFESPVLEFEMNLETLAEGQRD
jgi:hypothetical protein